MNKRPAIQPASEVESQPAPGETAPAVNAQTSRRWDGLFNPDPAAVPGQVGRFTLIRKLGQGGMGAVFLAEDRELERRVALKFPHPGAIGDRVAHERFLTEARAAAGLRHANICPVHDVGEHDGLPYITMAFIEGESLADRLAGGGPLPPGAAANLVGKLAAAVAEAHARGVIHRDLKPANVMIDRRGEPILMDFGLARRESADTGAAQLTGQGQVMGSPSYMSPEQAEGDVARIGPATDVYGLGAILYECLTGSPPFRGSIARVLAQVIATPPAAPSTLRPGIPPNLEAACLQALAKDPAGRFPSVVAFAVALAPVPMVEALDDPTDQIWADTVEEPAEIRPRSKPTPRKRRGIIAAVIGFIALMLIAIVATVVLMVKTPRGTLVVESDDPDAELVVKGEGVTIRTKDRKIDLKVGDYTIEVAERKDGLKLSTSRFAITKGGKEVIRVRLEKPAPKSAPAVALKDGFGYAWPAEDLAAMRIKAPDLSGERVLLDDKFQENDNTGMHGSMGLWFSYADGQFTVRQNGGTWGNSGHTWPTPVAIEMAARIEGNGERYWGMLFYRYPGETPDGIQVTINGDGQYAVGPGSYSKRSQLGPALSSRSHPAVKPYPELNRILVIVRPRLAEIYINDVAVGDPINLPFDLPQGHLQFRMADGWGRTVVERYRVRSAIDVPTPDKRGATVRPKPPAAAAHRAIAQRLGQIGGKFNIGLEGYERHSVPVIALPEGPFEILAAHLAECRVNRDDIAALRDVQTLQILGLAGVADRDIQPLKDHPALRLLHLQGTPVTDEGMKTVGTLKRLQELRIDGTRVTADGIEPLKGLTDLRGLAANNLPRTGDTIAAATGSWPELLELGIPRTGLTDAGCRDLARCRKLLVLDAAEATLSADGLRSLANIKSLRRLRLHDVAIDPKDYALLAPLRNLNQLALTGRKHDEAALNALSIAMPQTTIYVDGKHYHDGEDRRLWRGGDRRFQYTGDGNWVDVLKPVVVVWWKEVARTAEYVEVVGPENARLRLWADRLETAGASEFNKSSAGGWVTAEQWVK